MVKDVRSLAISAVTNLGMSSLSAMEIRSIKLDLEQDMQYAAHKLRVSFVRHLFLDHKR